MNAAQLVQALSVAWSGTHLYPDPLTVPAFQQAVESIGEAAGSALVLTVTVDGFEHRGDPVSVNHSAADRLIQALFAERVESLAVISPPTGEQVVQFFAMLGESEGLDDVDLDLPTRLQLAGVEVIRVHCHDPLEDRDEEEEEEPEDDVERDPEVQALFAQDSVGNLADRFMTAGSPPEAGEQFATVYIATYGRVTEDDPAGLQRVVQTFVDAFFKLDHDYRTAAFHALLENRGEVAVENFLDQLSPNELAELAGEADDAALPLLIEYARVVAEMQGRDQSLVERVQEAADAGASRDAVAGSVGMRLASFLDGDGAHAGAVEALRSEIEALEVAPRVGWTVLGHLFEIEGRPNRVKRLLRIWTAKLSASIKAASFTEAVTWLDVIEGHQIDARALDNAFNQVASNEVMALLTGEGPDKESRDKLLVELSRRSGSRVVEQLGAEEDPGRRRMLIDIVTEIARVDIRSILPGLSDPRWYVVRNLAIALGKSGRRAAGEPLAGLLEHEDHRVRIEALRALIPCLGDAAVDHLIGALADEHVRVRAAAGDLLEVVDDALAVPALSGALRNESTPLDVRIAAVEALGKRKNEDARVLLNEVADMKTRFSGSARTLRSAARDALRSGRA